MLIQIRLPHKYNSTSAKATTATVIATLECLDLFYSRKILGDLELSRVVKETLRRVRHVVARGIDGSDSSDLVVDVMVCVM